MRYDIAILIVLFTAILVPFPGCKPTPDNAAPDAPSVARRDESASHGPQAPAAGPQNRTPAPDSPDDGGVSADDLFAAGRYADALAVYKKRIEQEPANETLLYNAGHCAYLIGQYDDAAESWLALEKLAGDKDLGVKEKLIQAYEKLDQPDEVEKRIAELVRLRQGTKDAEYKQKTSFCRDQFTIGDEQFLAYHHFDFPTGDESRFSAVCAGSDGEAKYWFRFWSSETTNAIAREHGELKDGERLFHIDEYRPDGSKINHLHTTDPLSYREFKKFVTDLFNKPRK